VKTHLSMQAISIQQAVHLLYQQTHNRAVLGVNDSDADDSNTDNTWRRWQQWHLSTTTYRQHL